MRINQNIAALNAYRNLNNTDTRLNRSLERLSSGMRINRAADDAAGLSISEKMRAQIRGLGMSMRNAQDGISLIQTAEGAIQEVHSMLQRMRELSVQAANETYTSADRMEIQEEIEQLKDEINRIASSTEFNTRRLLDGSASAIVSTDDPDTHVYMRDGLRYHDQFGQVIEGGGNYKIDIDAEEIGAAQVQKSNIFMVKHESPPMVMDQEHGQAIKLFDGIPDEEMDITITIDGNTYNVQFTSGDTAALADAINEQVGENIITAYGEGEGSNEDWLEEDLGNDQLLLILDGEDVQDQTQFTISASSDDTDNLGDLPTSPETYHAEDSFIEELEVHDPTEMLHGNYDIDLDREEGSIDEAEVVSEYSQKGNELIFEPIAVVEDQDLNISTMLEVEEIDHDNDEVVVRAYYTITDETGAVVNEGDVLKRLDAGASNDLNIGGFDFDDGSIELASSDAFEIGDRMVLNARSIAEPDPNIVQTVTINRNNDTAAEFSFAGTDSSRTLNFYQLDENTGEYTQSQVTVDFAAGAWEDDVLVGLGDVDESIEGAASFRIDSLEVGDLAVEESRLYDIREFWDANGRFLLENPRDIRVVQGDGEQTTFTIDQNDTLGTLKGKINQAMGEELGQERYLAQEGVEFVDYVGEGDASEGHLSTEGTMVVRSVIPGRQGEIDFFGNSDLINALGFQTIQDSEETIFDISVYDAHTNEPQAENVRISSNLLVGAVHPNVDVEFNPLAGMGEVQGLDDRGGFDLQAGDTHETFIHLKDSTMVFQIGPNPGQDVGAAIGRMDSRALGIDGVLVTDRLKANNAVDFIDRAMDIVSRQRSKLGAIQNRLEHTVNSLEVANENLTAAESRIRDLDIAEEMVNFTKDQILMQAGSAMLAEANMKPQAIMQLLG